MMSNISNKIEFKQNIAPYLLELKKLTGIDIEPEYLSSPEDMEKIRKNSLVLEDIDKIKFVMNFRDKSRERFKKFIKNLTIANHSPVYIWTDKSNICGLYEVASIDAIDFSLTFDINLSGTIVFLTEDLNDRLLLDFYHDYEDQEMLEVEVKGKNWYSVPF